MPEPRPATVTDEHLKYLDKLRESGITNMYGATPYIMRTFGVSRQDAIMILTYWMRSFGERHHTA